ncbi:hypothetical protein MIV020R [Invertebrate iridescent virus 3]|uniref:Uncharacterized protein 020R n=1 Tax=Invertebrate iridescent virus 3 TaxID=345201 RepID=VF196_IIV3|nr:hypothetical protein MIV020R [Invertebrate iridescent virus 3]Q197E0.1 RecName: Full=Uncharacterized protein 020R [Invertebrate iridescent virus 3]ABF82050.1 hypothetical protein MIV020R [Invertebrate iridescent virus 3]
MTNLSRGLLLLEDEDFTLVENQAKTFHLSHTVSGKYSIVMFYTDTCPQCSVLKPIVLYFVGDPLLQICLVNVYDSDSQNIIPMSLKSTTPLEYVPFIVFYVNGLPFKIFDGESTLLNFKNFILQTIQEADQIPTDTAAQQSEIPSYTLGKPKSSKVCYLTYEKAY